MWAVLSVVLFFAGMGLFLPFFFCMAATGNYLYLLLPAALVLGSVYCSWKATWGRLK